MSQTSTSQPFARERTSLKAQVGRNALLVPLLAASPRRLKAPPLPGWPVRRSAPSVGGVLTETGLTVDLGPMGTFNRNVLPPLRQHSILRQDAERLEGRWIFGGLLRDHFGHIITNALGRLWVADHVGDVSGVLFLRDKTPSEHSVIYSRLAEVLRLPQDHRILSRPVVAESLVVAPDLFSEARDCVADPAFNRWLDARFPSDCEATRRVYVTRSRLDPLSGRLLCEDILEENFKAAGFEVFVPETASMAEQVAVYRQSREIVSTDGSALHLAALVAGPEARVTILLRRPKVHRIFTNHMADRFGERLNLVSLVKAHWFPEDDTRRMAHTAFAELDYAALQARLVADGVIDASTPWRVPTRQDVTASCALGRTPEVRFVRSKARM